LLACSALISEKLNSVGLTLAVPFDIPVNFN
jgi:hypothetical protein